MGSRSLGELLLRPTLLSRISFAQNLRRAAPAWSTYRMISNSNNAQSAQPQHKEDNPFAPYKPSSSNAPSHNQTSTGAQQTSEAIDSLFSEMPSYPRRSPAAYTPASQQKSAEQMSRVFGANFTTGGTRQTFTRRTGLDMDSMDMSGLSMPMVDKPATPIMPEKQVFPRLNPAYGRTINLQPEQGRDLVRGLNMLGSLMARNKVRADFMKQRFHERPGLKRKRLKSERWRARFKQGFKEVTGRVSELTRKGW